MAIAIANRNGNRFDVLHLFLRGSALKADAQNCPAEIADEKPCRRQFVDLQLIDHGANFLISCNFPFPSLLLSAEPRFS